MARFATSLLLAAACGRTSDDVGPGLLVDCPTTVCRETITVPAVALGDCYGWDPSAGWPEETPAAVAASCVGSGPDCVFTFADGERSLDDVCHCVDGPDIDAACCRVPEDPIGPGADDLLLELEASCGLRALLRMQCDPPGDGPASLGPCPDGLPRGVPP